MYLMTKEIRINVRTKADIKRDLEITAILRGLTVSSLVNSLVVKAIREEKDREPSAFVPETQTIGDDMIQKRTQGYVVPDSFTHGSSEQRVTWFKRGFDSGDLKQCQTFK